MTGDLVLDYRRDEAIRLLAIELAERRTRMPAYLVDDEQWAGFEAQATDMIDHTPMPPAPTGLQAAVLVARGHGRFGTAEWVAAARRAWF